MIFKFIILVYGLSEFIVGSLIWFRKSKFLTQFILTGLTMNLDIKYEDIKEAINFSKWIGEITIMQGALNVFLASASVYFQINIFLVVVFLLLIETFFFRVQLSGFKKFL